jgi:hypothetical protein
MTPEKEALARQKCLEKCARGNHYATEALAAEAAESMSRDTGDPIHPFRCLVGNHWHVGRYRNPAELRARGQAAGGAA